MSGPLFTVVYTPAARGSLTTAWIAATDRNAVTHATTLAEGLLRRNPSGVGRAISEGLLGLDLPPVSITYSVSDDDRLVTVTAVRLLMPPKAGNGRPPTRKV